MIEAPKKRRGRPPKAASTDVTHIRIAAKKVFGDNGQKFFEGAVLEIGTDVSVEVAGAMIENGTAVTLNGKTLEASDQEIRVMKANQVVAAHKQRADQVMADFDRQSDETREVLRETNGEPLDE